MTDAKKLRFVAALLEDVCLRLPDTYTEILPEEISNAFARNLADDLRRIANEIEKRERRRRPERRKR